MSFPLDFHTSTRRVVAILPRSLFGLWHPFTAQKKTDDPAWVRGQFLAAWKHADISLPLTDF